MFYKRLFIFVLFFTFYLLLTPKTQAAENFHTSYNFTYNLTNNSSSHVAIDVSLRNNTSALFASSYKMQLGFSDMKNLSIFDNGQKIPFKIIPNDNGTQIDISFTDKVVGINKVRHFVVTFDTSEVSQNFGSAWEVNIPGSQKYSTIDDFNAVVNFPQQMEQISYIKPQVKNLIFDGKTLKLLGNQIRQSGISIAFGDYQVYDFNLTYHLKNTNFFPITSDIALPPNTSHQDVLIESMNPKPKNVTQDSDGNWIATYSLGAAKTLEVSVAGKARVLLIPKKESISEEEGTRYLSSQKYWEVSDQKISETAKRLKTPKAIYNFVVTTLSYDFSRVKNNQERLGAARVLGSPSSASCWEFTDLFIALSRAAGIPAREVVGFAYTNNSRERPLSLVQDVLHAWPQYYDEDLGTWVDVDPTWGNTTSGIDYFNTFDFDHIAFVIQGSSSTLPTPAGGYKAPIDFGRKDVFVTPSRNFHPQQSSISIESMFDKNYISGLPIEGRINAENQGNSITPATSFLLSNELLKSAQNIKINQIPPFGHQEIWVNLGSADFLTNYEGTAKIQLGNAVFYEAFYSKPFYKNTKLYIGVIAVGILIIGLLISFKRSRRISSKK